MVGHKKAIGPGVWELQVSAGKYPITLYVNLPLGNQWNAFSEGETVDSERCES